MNDEVTPRIQRKLDDWFVNSNAQCRMGDHNKCGGKVSHQDLCICDCHGKIIETECGHPFRVPEHWNTPELNGITGFTTDCVKCGMLLIIEEGQYEGQRVGRDFVAMMRADLDKMGVNPDECEFGVIEL